jgi:hypothetical protein
VSLEEEIKRVATYIQMEPPVSPEMPDGPQPGEISLLSG